MEAQNLIKELSFKAIRSGGAGGQHVNKVSTKIVLFFDVARSDYLSDEEKEWLINKLYSKLTKENILILNCDESRSQHKNKEIVIERFLQIITNALKIKKPSKSSVKKRLDSKKKIGLKKISRKKPDFD